MNYLYMFYKGHFWDFDFELFSFSIKGLKFSSMYLAQNFHVPVNYKVIFVTNISSSCPDFDLKCVCKP